MAKQDSKSDSTKNTGNTYSYHGKKLGVHVDPDAHLKRRDKDEEKVRELLRDLIYTEIKNLFVKK